MKKLLQMASLFLAVAATTNANSQTENVSPKEFVSNSDYSAKATANDRVISKFQKFYPNVEGESWIKMKNGFSVRFSSNNIQQLVFLTKRGGVISSIKYYSAQELSTEIRDLVKYEYPNYSIKSVREVHACNKIAYLVTIEDATTWKTIRVIDGETDVYEEFTKS
jgi:hypothetical protein